MRKIDMIIHSGHAYTMAGEGCGYLRDHALALDGGKIMEIGPSRQIAAAYAAEKEINAPHMLALPGFIDCHMHSGHGVLRGMAQDMRNWMMEGMAPLEAQRSIAAKDAGTMLAIAEAILNGTTTVGEDGANVGNTLAFIEKIGVRGNVSPRIREVPINPYREGELYEYHPGLGEESLNQCLELFDRYHNCDGGRIRILFGPQGADFLSLELLLKVKALAAERNANVHMHLQQGARESAQMLMRYGRRTIPLLESIGFFDRNLIGVHMVDATEAELRTLAAHDVAMVLCSSSMAMIRAEIPPAVLYQQMGGRVGLGSDQAPGNNGHNMFNEMRLAALLNKVKYHDPEVMPAWKALRMATIEGARALGLEAVTGSLEVGKAADIILIDLRQPALMPVYSKPMRNLIPNLVYSAKGSEVDTVIVAGRILVEHKKPLTFDPEEIFAAVQAYADQIGEKAAPEFWRIHGSNAAYMEQGKL